MFSKVLFSVLKCSMGSRSWQGGKEIVPGTGGIQSISGLLFAASLVFTVGKSNTLPLLLLKYSCDFSSQRGKLQGSDCQSQIDCRKNIADPFKKKK